MSELFPRRPVDRRAAMKTMVSAGVGLLACGPPNAVTLDNSTDTLAQVLPDFSVESRTKLQALLGSNRFSGQIPAATVHELLSSEPSKEKTIASLMLALLSLARTFSRPTISNYRVGTIARGESGSLYLGFNVEFPHHALGFAVHGEQAALSSAYMHGESGVTAIALTAAPCGHCRQFMMELSPDGKIEILVEHAESTRLSTLLPSAFGPKDLGRKDGAFPVKQTMIVASALTGTTTQNGETLLQSSLDAARSAYAPYTEAFSGAAISTRSGRIYKGSYIENVAFNPSLSPLQTALVQLIVAGEDYSAISRVALAEINGGKISQKSATEAVLSTIAPLIRLEMVSGESGASFAAMESRGCWIACKARCGVR